MPISLSRRQIGDADRVGGIELMILWPAALGPEPGEDYVGLDRERDANAREKATAEALVRSACEAAGLVPVHVRVVRLRRPGGPNVHAAHEERVHLAVTIIGRRWVHASTQNRGRVAWASEAP